MLNNGYTTGDADQAKVYQIQLQGHLEGEWAEWFEGLTMTLSGDGTMVLTGPVADQAALHGLLRKVRDLGMTLLSVVCVCAETEEQS